MSTVHETIEKLQNLIKEDPKILDAEIALSLYDYIREIDYCYISYTVNYIDEDEIILTDDDMYGWLKDNNYVDVQAARDWGYSIEPTVVFAM